MCTVAMATPTTSNQPEKFTHSVRHLTRLSSQGDYVVVDKEAPSVLLKSATRIKAAHSRCGLFYEVYHSTKSKAKSLFSGPPQSTGLTAAVSGPSTDPYDTSDWDDEQSDEEHYIIANNVARYGTVC